MIDKYIDMEVGRDEYDVVKKNISLCDKNPTYEFECSFLKAIDKPLFNTFINYFKRSTQFKMDDVLERDSLDISYDDTRITLNGSNDIREYCINNVLSSHTIIKKTRVNGSPKVNINEYDVNLNLKNEAPVSKESFDYKTLVSKFKTFRKKHRYSFTDTSTQRFRVDLTIVKQSRINSKTLIESGVMKSNEFFEIEIEYLNDIVTETRPTDTQLIGQFFNIVQIVLHLIDDTPNLMSKTLKKNIVSKYISLVSPSLSDKLDLSDKKTFENIYKNPKKYFLSYQPITLERHNIIKGDINYVSILDNYTVMEKTDGERMLLFVDDTNDVYSINNRMNVKKTGLKHISKNSLIDGEFVKKGKYGTVLNAFMCFDIYFVNGEDMRDMPLVPGRVDAIKQFCDTVKNPENIVYNVRAKEFHHGSDIFSLAKKTYDGEKYKYHIDGLIFTPANLAVGTTYNKELSTRNTFGGTWNRVFKWKPLKENSIDMLVSFVRTEFVVEHGKCVLCNLQVAHNSTTDSVIDPYDSLMHKMSYSKTSFTAKTFASVYLTIGDSDSYPRSNMGELVYDNSVVEFIYNHDSNNKMFLWSPYRVRYDKTDLYNKSNSISNTANSSVTAQNVLRSIQKPVTYEHIIGTSVVNDIEVDSTYYSRVTQRNNLLSKPLSHFHNTGVKQVLYNLFKNKNFKLVDMACGKGGDLNKWYSANFKMVVGFDINLDNILNPIDGIYKRHANSFKFKNLKNQKMIFLQKDVSKPWKRENDKIESEKLKNMYDSVWGIVNKEKVDRRDAMNPYINIMKENFDVVSCQFAIHYMFESEESLDTFCKNVNDVMKVGGYFIGTCLNGVQVKQELLKSNDSLLEGVIDDNLIWRIDGKFDNISPNVVFGERISVYMESIGKVFDEFLVDIGILESKLKKWNIKLLVTNDLKKLDIKSSFGGFKELYKNEFKMKPVLEEYSFMNMWFVFKKYDK